jgi:hypothetical protein
MNTTIARTGAPGKFCKKCKQEVFTFHIRKNLKHGKVQHLQCPTKKG